MTVQAKKKFTGFTLIELLIAMGVTTILLYAAVIAFHDASQSNQLVAQGADMSENLRSGLNMIILDLQQAGTGIPTGGISIPFTAPCGTTPAINRPILGGTSTFPYPGATCESTIPAVEPGNAMGPFITAPDATSGNAQNPNSITDEITMLYADNTAGLDGVPINQPASAGPPAVAGCPNGSLQLTGTTLTATFDINCVNISSTTTANLVTIHTGDLIMFSNTKGNTLLTVTGISGQVLTFAAGDAFKLNGRSEAGGTIQYLQTSSTCGGTPACFPVTLATRIWMITYYLDNVTSPPYTRLIRQVNLNSPTPVGETMENLQFTYNFVDGVTNPTNQNSVPTGNSEANIRSVDVYLASRSSHSISQSNKAIYSRSNLMTQVSLRSLAYVNRYQ